MSDIDHIELRRLDLTILLVFLGLMRHRKATVVARDMGLTQSAISHSLKRLRDVFRDDLFIRRPHGLEPTSVASALEAEIERAVDTLRGALRGPPAFDPAESQALIRIGALDSELATLLPRLMKSLNDDAPKMRLAAHTMGRRAAIDALSARDIDLALGFFWDAGKDVMVDPLYEESYLVIGRRGSLPDGRTISLSRYLTARHLVVSASGDLTGIVDRTLAEKGLERRVVAAVPLFFPAFAAVAETGLLATVPSWLARTYARSFDLAHAKPPVPIRQFTVAAARHKRDAHNPMHAWLLDRLRPRKDRRG